MNAIPQPSIEGMDFQWESTARTIALSLSGKIPEVGGAVAFLVSKYWPDNKPTIWQQIQAQVQTLVDISILKDEYERDALSIDGLKTTMNRYIDDVAPQKGITLTVALGKADDLFSKLTKSSNAIHLIPLSVVLSQLHLLLLAEQNQHGTVIFSEPGKNAVPYNPRWADELTQQRIKYRKFFRDIYQQWWTWRISNIEADWGRSFSFPVAWTAYGSAKDKFLDLELSYSDSENSVTDYFKGAALGGQSMYQNRARADMAGALAPTFLLNLYDPKTANDVPDVDPALAYFSLGPYCPATLGWNKDGRVSIAKRDVPGKLTSFTIQAGNSIDLLQLHFDGHDGVPSGHATGGSPGTIGVPTDRHCTGFQASINNQLLFSITAQFSDGSSYGPYGNAGHWSGAVVDMTVNDAYALYGGEYTEGNGPSSTSGTSLIQLSFCHASRLNNPQVKSCLTNANYLKTWDYLVSPGGKYYCVMQADANLCTYLGIGSPNAEPVVWDTDTPRPIGDYYLIMQSDGNLCLYAGEGPPNSSPCIWESGVTGPIGDYFVVLDDEARLHVYAGKPNAPGANIWSSPAVLSQ